MVCVVVAAAALVVVILLLCGSGSEKRMKRKLSVNSPAAFGEKAEKKAWTDLSICLFGARTKFR